jgi:hypothetical protein
MAHFAEIDENNIVLRVLVIDNSLEAQGADFLANTLGFGGTWIQTSYNGNIRKNFAGIGYTYDELLDAFLMPKCHDEATLNLDSYLWECDNNDHQVPII